MTKGFIKQVYQRAHPFLAFGIILMFSGCSCNDPLKPNTNTNKDSDKESKNSQVAQLDTSVLRKKLDADVTEAEAIITPLGDNPIRGKVFFKKTSDGVKVIADIEGLAPGEHGFHVHEYGECGGKDGAAAGAHFNPTQTKHGGPDSVERHVGDLGNIFADENGRAHYERVDKLIQLQGKNSILGRSVIIHSDKDDYETQPSGASGAKIGCGIIQPRTNK